MNIKFLGISIKLSRGTAAVLILILLTAAGAAGFFINMRAAPVIVDTGKDGPGKQDDTKLPGASAGKTAGVSAGGSTGATAGAQSDRAAQDAASEQQEEIKVYVIGCVNSPGIVTLKKGQLIDDAVKAAGGATDEADLENVNLVYKLKENVMLVIRAKGEKNTGPQALPDAQSDGAAGKGAAIVNNSAGAIPDLGASQGALRKININTASVDELDTLPGIGKETAKDIVAYREKSGGFSRPEDLMKVPGIKQSRFGSIKDLVTVD